MANVQPSIGSRITACGHCSGEHEFANVRVNINSIEQPGIGLSVHKFTSYWSDLGPMFGQVLVRQLFATLRSPINNDEPSNSSDPQFLIFLSRSRNSSFIRQASFILVENSSSQSPSTKRDVVTSSSWPTLL